MKKKIIKIVLIILIIFLGYTLIKHFYNKNQMKNIETIDVYAESFFGGTQGYTVDFVNNELWGFDVEGQPKDIEMELICKLEDDKINKFLNSASGMLSWKEKYITRKDILDGGSWGVMITFKDGSKKASGGYEAYPYNYDRIGDMLKELTGVDIF